MQENVPLWDPIAINRAIPLENRLQVFYLFFTLVFFIFRVIQIIRFLWISRKHPSSDISSAGLPIAIARNSSLKRAAIFTILLSFFFLVYGLADKLRTAVTEKLFFSSWGLDGRLSEDLGVLPLA